MDEIQRHDCIGDIADEGGSMMPIADGEYVKFDDYERDLAAARAQIGNLQACYESVQASARPLLAERDAWKSTAHERLTQNIHLQNERDALRAAADGVRTCYMISADSHVERPLQVLGSRQVIAALKAYDTARAALARVGGEGAESASSK